MFPFRRRSVRDGSGALGRRGETLARRYLRRKGMKILARNYRCRCGEADLIVLDRSAGAIAFVEVKSRSDDSYVVPHSAVDTTKQRRYVRIARDYLAGHPAGEYTIRFDVLSVVFSSNAPPQIEHIPDAFHP